MAPHSGTNMDPKHIDAGSWAQEASHQHLSSEHRYRIRRTSMSAGHLPKAGRPLSQLKDYFSTMAICHSSHIRSRDYYARGHL